MLPLLLQRVSVSAFKILLFSSYMDAWRCGHGSFFFAAVLLETEANYINLSIVRPLSLPDRKGTAMIVRQDR